MSSPVVDLLLELDEVAVEVLNLSAVHQVDYISREQSALDGKVNLVVFHRARMLTMLMLLSEVAKRAVAGERCLLLPFETSLLVVEGGHHFAMLLLLRLRAVFNKKSF